MASEKLKFKIELYATYWNKPPSAEIVCEDKHFVGNITGTVDKPNVIEFTQQFQGGQKVELIILRAGKGRGQTVLDNDGNVIKDQLLHIKNIEIDDINIGALVYEGVYNPHYPEPWATRQKQAGVELPKSLKNVVAMGHDGEWRFTFSSPFYMWLLENLY